VHVISYARLCYVVELIRIKPTYNVSVQVEAWGKRPQSPVTQEAEKIVATAHSTDSLQLLWAHQNIVIHYK
jgi:hypothetical protein